MQCLFRRTKQQHKYWVSLKKYWSTLLKNWVRWVVYERYNSRTAQNFGCRKRNRKATEANASCTYPSLFDEHNYHVWPLSSLDVHLYFFWVQFMKNVMLNLQHRFLLIFRCKRVSRTQFAKYLYKHKLLRCMIMLSIFMILNVAFSSFN